jgi:hypothetical protein
MAVYITSLPSRIMKLIYTREGGNSHINYINNVTRHGFTIQRYLLTIGAATINSASTPEITIHHNEWQYMNDTAAKDYHFCASSTSFLLLINKQRILLNNWNIAGLQSPYLHHNTWMNSHNILYSQCYSDNQDAPLLLVLANVGSSTQFMIFTTANVTDPNNFLILNQTLPENIADTATQLDNVIIPISRTHFYVRPQKKTYSFRMRPVDFTFQANEPPVPSGSEQITLNLRSNSISGTVATKSQNLIYNATAEVTSLEMTNPNAIMFPLTTNIAIRLIVQWPTLTLQRYTLIQPSTTTDTSGN